MYRGFRYIISFVFLSGIFNANAQLLDSLSFDTAYVYTNLQEALKNPQEVYRLSLRKKHLRSLPPEVYQFKNLNELDLGKNNIKELPAEIVQFQYLRRLNLERNELETLPKEIGKLKNVKELIINQNQIYALPWEIGDMENLEYLDLWSNNLSELPKTMKKLEKLRDIDMRVISLNQEQQDALTELLPQVKFQFSPACNCGK